MRLDDYDPDIDVKDQRGKTPTQMTAMVRVEADERKYGVLRTWYNALGGNYFLGHSKEYRAAYAQEVFGTGYASKLQPEGKTEATHPPQHDGSTERSGPTKHHPSSPAHEKTGTAAKSPRSKHQPASHDDHHQVQAGDTLSAIIHEQKDLLRALRKLDPHHDATQTLMKLTAEKNHLDDPDKIKAGQNLALPDIREIHAHVRGRS